MRKYDRDKNNTKKYQQQNSANKKKKKSLIRDPTKDEIPVLISVVYTRLETKEGEKELYRLAKQRNRDGKDVQQVRTVKDTDGNLLVDKDEVVQRWKQYFEELMNVENEKERRTYDGEVENKDVTQISKEEVLIALKKMKNDKAIGPDNIPVEAWKHLGVWGVKLLAHLFYKILETEKMRLICDNL